MKRQMIASSKNVKCNQLIQSAMLGRNSELWSPSGTCKGSAKFGKMMKKKKKAILMQAFSSMPQHNRYIHNASSAILPVLPSSLISPHLCMPLFSLDNVRLGPGKPSVTIYSID